MAEIATTVDILISIGLLSWFFGINANQWMWCDAIFGQGQATQLENEKGRTESGPNAVRQRKSSWRMFVPDLPVFRAYYTCCRRATTGDCNGF
jgi:hypothetical protein